jgi:hypothetical protein
LTAVSTAVPTDELKVDMTAALMAVILVERTVVWLVVEMVVVMAVEKAES